MGFKFGKILAPVLGGAAALLSGGTIPAALGAAGMAGSLFGGKKGGSPAQSQAGYGALPPQAKGLYDALFSQIGGIGGFANDPTRYGKAFDPSTNPYASQALYELQQANPESNIRPLGSIEPFNQYQQNALNQYGNPDYSPEGSLSQYFNPYRQVGSDAINRGYDISASKLRGDANARNPLGANSSARAIQMQLQEESRMRALAENDFNSFEKALGLRSQSLSDMLNAGNLVQRQNQAELQSALPQNAGMYNPQYQYALLQSDLLSKAIPQTSYSSGATPEKLTTTGKASNLLSSLFGNQFQGLFG